MQKPNQVIDSTNTNLSYAKKPAIKKGAPSWLNDLPTKKHSFWLKTSKFTDALFIRQGRDFKNEPSTCACGSAFLIAHVLHCSRGGYLIIMHNGIQNLFANLMKKVYHDVEVEPNLQPLENCGAILLIDDSNASNLLN